MPGKNWVILVAGTKGWANYRDQANVCCAYQQIKKQVDRIPDDQIVVMMYDDIAYNPNNPYKGKIVSVVDDSNVYQSVPKDYTGNSVTPKDFLAALKGCSPGKNVLSVSQDNIFIYFSGIGNENAFLFPDQSQLLNSDFIKAIEDMNNNKKFSKMVIYVESTNSTNMFSALSATTNAYAVTSRNSTICNHNQDIGVFLSDKFSAALLKIFANTDLKRSTFQDLNNFINIHIEDSVKEFGDKRMESSNLSVFLEKQ